MPKMFNGIIQLMKLTKSGAPDKRYKNEIQGISTEDYTKQLDDNSPKEAVNDSLPPKEDPNNLLDRFLKENNIELVFDTVTGFVASPTGIKRLENQLVIKAIYVTSR